ncbi:actin-related protein 4 isoform X1 [Iris pallida]|uniref:Actin-related protein 4 isoform X1 n=1 Tax=Iris pallida TaxID=29817 RepID=A0AAX6FSC3_IRIPA|nr:actin-related protein 4 isoform X1 [Iris pallida]
MKPSGSTSFSLPTADGFKLVAAAPELPEGAAPVNISNRFSINASSPPRRRPASISADQLVAAAPSPSSLSHLL